MSKPPEPEESRASARHTICFSQGMFDLANAWAKAEGRTIGSLLTYVLETGLRTMVAQGLVPSAAINAYEKRAWERSDAE